MSSLGVIFVLLVTGRAFGDSFQCHPQGLYLFCWWLVEHLWIHFNVIQGLYLFWWWLVEHLGIHFNVIQGLDLFCWWLHGGIFVDSFQCHPGIIFVLLLTGGIFVDSFQYHPGVIFVLLLTGRTIHTKWIYLWIIVWGIQGTSHQPMTVLTNHSNP